MSQYRDELDAARHRIETLEAEVAERDAALRAREAQIAEHRREIDRVRTSREGMPRKAEKENSARTTGAVWVMILVSATMMIALWATFIRMRTYQEQLETLSELIPRDQKAREHEQAAERRRREQAPQQQPGCADSANCVEIPAREDPVPEGAGFLNIHSSPISKVMLDGKPIGSTPLASVRVTPGSHILTFTHSERAGHSVHVTVEDGKTQTISTKLPQSSPDPLEVF